MRPGPQGDAYDDLGATATDSQGNELSVHPVVGSTPMEFAAIDTTTPVTYHIHYVATDMWGNTATSTRAVIVQPAATSSP